MNDILTDEKDLLYIKNFIARELLEIDVSTGEKIYREVKKVYVVKKNKEMDLQNKKKYAKLRSKTKRVIAK